MFMDKEIDVYFWITLIYRSYRYKQSRDRYYDLSHQKKFDLYVSERKYFQIVTSCKSDLKYFQSL